jgi:hypothetical protein
MACGVLVETINKQGYTPSVSCVSGGIILAMPGRKRENSMAEDRTLFDFFWYPQGELTSCICAVKPSAKMLCVVMYKHSVVMGERDGHFGKWPCTSWYVRSQHTRYSDESTRLCPRLLWGEWRALGRRVGRSGDIAPESDV